MFYIRKARVEDEEEDEVETLGREVKRLKLNSEFGLLERKAAWFLVFGHVGLIPVLPLNLSLAAVSAA